MSDTPTSKVEALRESFLRLGACSGPYDTPHRCSSMHCNYCELCDVSEDVLKAFATFLERVPGVAKRDLVEPVTKRPVKPVGDKVGIDLEADLHGSLKFIQDNGYNQAIDCYDEALHQVVTALRGGE